MPRPTYTRFAIVLGLWASAACSSDKSVGPGPDPTPPAVTAVTLARDTATIVPGASVKLNATATGSAGQTLDRTITWSSSDTAKARVASDGIIVGVSAGSAVITATSETITARATITILDGGFITPAGGTVRTSNGLVTIVAPASAVTENTSVVVQPASNPPASTGLIPGSAFTITPITATLAQPATLTLKYNAASLGAINRGTLQVYMVNSGAWLLIAGSSVDSANGTVSAPISKFGTFAIIGTIPPATVASITLDITSLSLYSGLTRQVTATLKDAGGTILTGRSVSWTSSSGSIAGVNASGGITSGGFGSATITASVDGRSATVSVSVKHDPIIFVHGFASSGQIWGTMIGSLIADGWLASDLTNWSYDATISNATIGQQLKTKADSVIAATGALKIDIITHSMGALSSRYYARELGGSDKIEAWVSLGGPNHGTTTANFCGLQSCLEMRPGSSFLAALNTGDETPGATRYGTWRTPCDNVTTPPESVILSGATNTETACLEHSDLYQNATVYAQVRDFIR